MSVTAFILLAINIPFWFASLAPQRRDPAAPRQHIIWFATVPLIITLFAYIGVESGFSSWIYTQITRVVGATDSIGTFGNSLFWVGVLVGRSSASAILRFISDELLVLIGAFLIGAGGLILLLIPQSEAAALFAAFVVGTGAGPMFPTILGITAKRFPENPGAVSGVLIAIGTLGGVAIPPLQGLVGGGTSGGMAVTVLLAVLIFVLGWYIRTTQPKHTAT
jgi:fucose permease